MAARGLPPPWGAEMPNDNPELFGGASWHAPTPCAAPHAFREPTVELLHYPASRSEKTPNPARVSGPALAPLPLRRVSVREQAAPESSEASSPDPVVEQVAARTERSSRPEGEPQHSQSDEARREDRAPAVQLVEVPAGVPGDQANQLPEPAVNDFERFVASLVGVAMKRGETRAAAQLRCFLETESLVGSELGDASKRILLERGFIVDEGATLRPTAAFQTVLSSWRRTLSGEDSELDATGDETLDQWASSLLGAWLGCEEDNLPTLRRALRKSGVLAFGMRAA